MGLFVLALFTHPLIDIFTVYGTQLFAPFSLTRVAWNALAIIDPFYSGILVAGLAAGLAWRRRPPRVRAAGFAALGLSWSYMFYGVWLNDRAESDVRAALVAEGRTGVSVRAYPTILQPYLRRVVAHDGDEVLVGLYTPFRPGEPVLQAFREPDHPLIDALARTPEGSLFVWFAMGEVTARVREGRERFVVEIDDEMALPQGTFTTEYVIKPDKKLLMERFRKKIATKGAHVQRGDSFITFR